MKKDYDTFTFRREWYLAIKGIEEHKQLAFMHAVLKYAFFGIVPNDPDKSFAFTLIKNSIDEERGVKGRKPRQEKKKQEVRNATCADTQRFLDFVQFFNSMKAEKKSSVPAVKSVTESRKALFLRRCKDFGEEKVYEAARLAFGSKFLNGDNAKGWTATFDWILNPTNIQKILDGNYADKEGLTYEEIKRRNEDRRRSTDVLSASAEEYKGDF